MNRKVAILVSDGCRASIVSAILDVFHVANECIENWYAGNSNHGYKIEVVSEQGKPIKTACGRTMLVDDHIKNSQQYDLIVVVESDIFTAEKNKKFIDYGELSRAAQWLRSRHIAGSVVCSLGGAIHLLAKSSILSDQEVAVNYDNYEVLNESFPNLKFTQDKVSVNKNIITVKSSQDFILGIFNYLNIYSKEQIILNCCEKIKALGLRSVDAEEICSIPNFDHDDLLIKKAQIWLLLNFTGKKCIEDLPTEIGMGVRNFKRRFKLATGKTPTCYLQEIRILAAKNWLKETDTPAYEISEKVGYSDFSSFCRLFKKHTGQSMNIYRKEVA